MVCCLVCFSTYDRSSLRLRIILQACVQREIRAGGGGDRKAGIAAAPGLAGSLDGIEVVESVNEVAYVMAVQ